MRLSRRYGAVGAPPPLVGGSECDGTGFGVKPGAPFKACRTNGHAPEAHPRMDESDTLSK
jgi:hypothetical protein